MNAMGIVRRLTRWFLLGLKGKRGVIKLSLPAKLDAVVPINVAVRAGVAGSRCGSKACGAGPDNRRLRRLGFASVDIIVRRRDGLQVRSSCYPAYLTTAWLIEPCRSS